MRMMGLLLKRTPIIPNIPGHVRNKTLKNGWIRRSEKKLYYNADCKKDYQPQFPR